MEESNESKPAMDSDLPNVDLVAEATLVEESAMIDQNQTVDQATTQQYLTYCIDPSRDIENRVSTNSTYNERGMLFNHMNVSFGDDIKLFILQTSSSSLAG
jgi:hypothetical protein